MFLRWAVDAVAAVLFVVIFTMGAAYKRVGLAEQVENARAHRRPGVDAARAGGGPVRVTRAAT